MTSRSFTIVWSRPRFRALSSVSPWIFVGVCEVPLVDGACRARGSEDDDPVVVVACGEDEDGCGVERVDLGVGRCRAVDGDACLSVSWDADDDEVSWGEESRRHGGSVFVRAGELLCALTRVRMRRRIRVRAKATESATSCKAVSARPRSGVGWGRGRW